MSRTGPARHTHCKRLPGMRRSALLLACLALLAGLADVTARAQAAPKPMRIAIVAFEAITEDARRNNKGRIVAERLTTAAVKSGLFEVVERHMVEQVFSEMEFGNAKLSGTDAQKLGHLLEAQYVLLGTVAEFGGELSIDSRLVQVRDGAIVLAESISATPSLIGIIQAATTLMDRMVQVIAPSRDTGSVDAFPSYTVPNTRALILEFLEKLFALQQTNDLDSLARLYGDPVLFYDQGEISRERIIREKRAYMKRWPRRSHQVYDLRISDTDRPDVKRADYNMRWRVSNDERTLSGTLSAWLLLEVQDGRVHIVGESSKVTSRD